MLVEIGNGIQWCFKVTPIVRKGWRYIQEASIEVTVFPPEREDPAQSPVAVVPGQPVIVAGRYRVRIINGRHDRRLRIIGGSAVLKRSNWWLWKKTVLEVPLYDARTRQPLDFVLEPQDRPLEFEVTANGAGEVARFPRSADLILVLESTGNPRYIERRLEKFQYTPPRRERPLQ